MAYRYTDPNTRAVFSPTQGYGNQAGKTAKFWLNADGTGPVDIGLYGQGTPETPGASTGSNQLTVQADGMWPAMWDRVGAQDHVYVQVGTASNPGALYRIFCDADQRMDAFATQLTATSSTASGAAQKSANLSDLASASTARTNLGLGNSATRAVGTTGATVAAGDAPATAQTAAIAAGKAYTDALPQRIPFGAARINPDHVVAAHAAAPQTTPTYDNTGQAVHPAVYYNPLGWGSDANGKAWRYWMAMTPYPNGDGATENPSIIVSDDGVTWVVPPGITNPIDAPVAPAFFPDPDFIELDGVLWCVYAVSLAKFSTDGVTWSARQGIEGLTGNVSSTVVKVGAQFWTWSVRMLDGTPYALHLQKAAGMLGPYGTATVCTFPVPPGKDVWHIQVRQVADTFFAVVALCSAGTTGADSSLYFATSADGVTWDVGAHPLLQPEPGTWTDQQIYRSAIVPYDGRDGTLFGLWYSAAQVPNVWRIGYTEITADRARSGLARTDRPNTIAAGQTTRGDARNRLGNPSLLLGADGGIVPLGYGNNLVGFSGHTWDEATEAFTALRASGTGATNIQLVHADTFVEGEVWTASVEVKISNPAAGDFAMSTLWLTSGDAPIGSSTIGAPRKDTEFWRIYVTSTVPANAAKLRITFSSDVTANPVQFWWRRAQLEKAPVPTSYAPSTAVVTRAAAGQAGNLQEWQTALGAGAGGGARAGMAVTKDARLKSGLANEQTTVGAAGTATALPSQPLKYIRVELDDGSQGVIPVYRQA